MNRKSRTAACRSPGQTRPRLLTEYRAPAAAACSHVAAGPTRLALPRPNPGSILLAGPRAGQPARPSYEWIGRSAQTRGRDRQDHVQHARAPPSGGETLVNTAGVFSASVAPLTKASGCPPIRVNPRRGSRERTYYVPDELARRAVPLAPASDRRTMRVATQNAAHLCPGSW